MSATNRKRFLKEFPEALHEGVGAVFVGAGVSKAAGYPTWAELLKDIAEELGVRSSDVHDLAALAQWHISETGGSTGVRSVIRKEIGKDRPVPPTLEIIARLPVRHIWTTNYDRLVERAFAAINRPIDVVSGAADLSLRARPGAARLYKMHGSVERMDDIVISTNDYELYRSKRGAFLPLLQAHLSSMSVLFVGLSLSDPNIRHVLSLIRESFTDAPPDHFAIVKPPSLADCDSEDEFKVRTAQHRHWAKDLRRYGLWTIEVENFDEIPRLMHQVERRVAAMRVWVSGSWPLDGDDGRAADLYRFSEAIGRLIAETDRDLVSGAGLLVGSAVTAGFIDKLRQDGGWDLDRRLIVRPFPQPLAGEEPDRERWAALRAEMARQAGIVIFLGGSKLVSGSPVVADGVLKEFEVAKEAGAFLLPIGSTGGAARQIADDLLGSSIPWEGVNAARPSDHELAILSSAATPAESLLKVVREILQRLAKPRDD